MKNLISFRKTVKALLRFSNDKTLDIFITFLLANRHLGKFFILLEEMVKQKIDTGSAEFIFMELISVHKYDIEVIIRYLNIIPNSKRKVLIHLIDLKQENALVEFIKNFPEFDSLLPML